jgi:tRNA (cytidine/uridine-2'-O-)-methyltransferase
MFNIVLYNPQIPPNTGNILRLNANSGCKLHLIQPLGFSLDDKHLKRAGMDYINRTDYILYEDFADFTAKNSLERVFLCTTKSNNLYSNVSYNPGDYFLFGSENKGVPESIHQQISTENKITIPMKDSGRSLNLATAVAIIMYEAWRQNNFK